MSSKTDSAAYAQSRTDTLIGAGVRVHGTITFAGVLRIQGDVRGDVTSGSDANGCAIVGQSGQVSGAINAAHIVVGGRVDGPLQATESIQIQRGGCVAGDASFKEIAIHAGGIIDGVLTTGAMVDPTALALEPRGQIPERSAEVEEVRPQLNSSVDPKPARRSGDRSGNWRKWAVAVLLLLAVGTVVLLNREALPPAASPGVEQAPAVVAAAPVADAPAPTAQPAPAASVVAVNPPVKVAEFAVTDTPGTSVETRSAAKAEPKAEAKLEAKAEPAAVPAVVSQAVTPAVSAANPEKVALVQGDNPDKSANAVYVVAQEPVVLFKKKLKDSGDGTRIELSRNGKKTLAIAPDEILRVGEGNALTIFYQGRKVGPNTIASGAWIRFVPRTSGGAGETH